MVTIYQKQINAENCYYCIVLSPFSALADLWLIILINKAIGNYHNYGKSISCTPYIRHLMPSKNLYQTKSLVSPRLDKTQASLSQKFLTFDKWRKNETPQLIKTPPGWKKRVEISWRSLQLNKVAVFWSPCSQRRFFFMKT